MVPRVPRRLEVSERGAIKGLKTFSVLQDPAEPVPAGRAARPLGKARPAPQFCGMASLSISLRPSSTGSTRLPVAWNDKRPLVEQPGSDRWGEVCAGTK